MSNVLGEATQHVEYSAFGETFFEERSSSNPSQYLYNAKERDEETGLYYYGARYYNATNSLWLSVDSPIFREYLDGNGNGGVFNPDNLGIYNYVALNPANFSDPNGKMRKSPQSGDKATPPKHKLKLENHGIIRDSETDNELTHYSGEAKPPTVSDDLKNSLYTQVKKNERGDKKGYIAVQNAIYNESGEVVVHVDFQIHDQEHALSGHFHLLDPGKPESGHGEEAKHHSHNKAPKHYHALPPDTKPQTEIGKAKEKKNNKKGNKKNNNNK